MAWKNHGVINPSKENFIEVIQSTFKENYTYKIFKIKNSRIYTDTITDTAFIVDNKIVEGPSFQHRNPKNAKITENIVFQKGTPKIKKTWVEQYFLYNRLLVMLIIGIGYLMYCQD